MAFGLAGGTAFAGCRAKSRRAAGWLIAAGRVHRPLFLPPPGGEGWGGGVPSGCAPLPIPPHKGAGGRLIAAGGVRHPLFLPPPCGEGWGGGVPSGCAPHPIPPRKGEGGRLIAAGGVRHPLFLPPPCGEGWGGGVPSDCAPHPIPPRKGEGAGGSCGQQGGSVSRVAYRTFVRQLQRRKPAPATWVCKP